MWKALCWGACAMHVLELILTSLQELSMVAASKQKLQDQLSEMVICACSRSVYLSVCSHSLCTGDQNANPVGKSRCNRRRIAQGTARNEEGVGRGESGLGKC